MNLNNAFFVTVSHLKDPFKHDPWKHSLCEYPYNLWVILFSQPRSLCAIYYHSLFLHVNDTAQNCKIFIFFNDAFHSYPPVSILFCMTVLIANITFQSNGNEITYVNYKIADVKFLRIMGCFSLPLFKSSSLSLSSYSSVS